MRASNRTNERARFANANRARSFDMKWPVQSESRFFFSFSSSRSRSCRWDEARSQRSKRNATIDHSDIRGLVTSGSWSVGSCLVLVSRVGPRPYRINGSRVLLVDGSTAGYWVHPWLWFSFRRIRRIRRIRRGCVPRRGALDDDAAYALFGGEVATSSRSAVAPSLDGSRSSRAVLYAASSSCASILRPIAQTKPRSSRLIAVMTRPWCFPCADIFWKRLWRRCCAFQAIAFTSSSWPSWRFFSPGPVEGRWRYDHAASPTMWRIRALPVLEIRPRCVEPPLECSLGTTPT